jgi:hypothetical protein
MRLTKPPKGSFFLFGVRGVGKSTWALMQFPNAHLVDLLDEGRYQRSAVALEGVSSHHLLRPTTRPLRRFLTDSCGLVPLQPRL